MSRLAAVALRLLAPRATAGSDTASGDDLANLDTSILPNHSMCWAGNTLYQLDRSQTSAGSGEIAPISGPGIWVPMLFDAAAPLSFDITVDGTIDAGFLAYDSTWTAFPTLTYVVEGGLSILPFTLAGAGAVLTNTGAERWFNITVYATVITLITDPADAGSNIGLMLSLNGARLGDIDAAPLAADSRGPVSRSFTATGAALGTLSFEQKVLLATGDTIQPAMWADVNAAVGAGLDLRHFRMCVAALDDTV